MTYYVSRKYEITNELKHHGIFGQKWGVRRFQNEDGTLTAAGKKRYERELKNYNKDKNPKQTLTENPNLIDAEKWANQDNTNLKSAIDDTRNAFNSSREIVRNANSNKKNAPLDLSGKSNDELRDAIQRANLEQQYNNIFNKPEVSKGAEYTEKFFNYAVPALGVVSSALGIALAIKNIRS